MAISPYTTEENLPFIIAEIGINHNGDLKVAKQLIDMAKACGADAVKFQKREIDIVYSKKVLDAPRESPWGATQRKQKEGLEFGVKEYDEIDQYCKEKKIPWFASAWDIKSQEFLKKYNLLFNKISSAMLTHKDIIDMVVKEGKHTIISTGMSNFKEIDRVVDVFRKSECSFTLMHCVSVYPCKDEWCNVQMITTLRERYECPVGYSGHEVGIVPSTLAVMLGAVCIERHITLDRSMYGSDQSASLERRGLEILVRDCRSVKKISGTGKKIVIQDEENGAFKLRYFREEDFNWD